MGRSIHLVIPMAGLGSRFSSVGYETPKPFLDIQGLPMIQRVIENNLSPDVDLVTLVIRAEHLDLCEQIVRLVKGPTVRLVELEVTSEGPASSVHQAITGDSYELLVANSDQLVRDGARPFLEDAFVRRLDGSLMTMEATGTKWSFVRRSRDGQVIEVREKVEISNEATVGVYWFRTEDLFSELYGEMIMSDDRTNGEFYVAPAYNYLIQRPGTVGAFHVGKFGEDVFGLGTPEDYEWFLAHRPMPL